MNEVRNFVMKHFKIAVCGCIDWNFDLDGIMYRTYAADRDAYAKMLVDTGLTYTEVMELESDIIKEKFEHNF